MSDEGLVELVSQLEFQRRALDRSVTTCVRAWPHARRDTEAIGFPGSAGDGPGGGGVCVDGGPTARLGVVWVERPEPSVKWLADLFDVIEGFAAGSMWVGCSEVRVGVLWHRWADDYADRFPANRKERRVWEVLAKQLYHLADTARVFWPEPPSRGSVVGGVTVGGRSSEVEVCRLCGGPIGGTALDPVKRLDSEPFHLRAPPGDVLLPPDQRKGSCFRRAWLSKGGANRLRVV